jgi:hypothetical protein
MTVNTKFIMSVINEHKDQSKQKQDRLEFYVLQIESTCPLLLLLRYRKVSNTTVTYFQKIMFWMWL